MNKLTYRISKYVSSYLSTTVIFCMDIFLSVVASGIVALLIASTSSLSVNKLTLVYLIVSLLASAIAFLISKTYRVVIRHSSMKDVGKFALALLGKEVLLAASMTIAFSPELFFAIFIGIDYLLSLSIIVIVRVIMIYVYEDFKRRSIARRNCAPSFIFGTSEKSVSLAMRLAHSPHYNIRGFIVSEQPSEKRTLVELPVFGFTDKKQLHKLTDEHAISAIIFAREKDAVAQDQLFQLASERKIRTLLAPSIDEVVGGKLHQGRVREIKIEDLLGRDEINISLDEIIANFHGKTVMVTGAAGSIGSELCRQLASFGIKQLILFDNAETPMHNLRLELSARFPMLDFVPVIGDVRSPERVDYAMRNWHPQVVFHAAAYKHVPLMEENPCEAVLVNVFGSRNVADKCIQYDVEKMIMISTDKAVNPTNIMGCTKRLAEIYVQSLGSAIAAGKIQGRTSFVTTRFGNVLGSNGSVIPHFREQIENGGPVTVTDKRIIRYFMTIPEACRLVMEAETLPTANKICVFDMGQPVKIDDLARRMIELAGFVPDRDIKIEYTGLRPGEKLYEEVLATAENTIPTTHKHINIAKVREYDYFTARDYASQLTELARSIQIPDLVRLMKTIVPEYISQNSEFEAFDKK